jgi:hypothetical protein
MPIGCLTRLGQLNVRLETRQSSRALRHERPDIGDRFWGQVQGFSGTLKGPEADIKLERKPH